MVISPLIYIWEQPTSWFLNQWTGRLTKYILRKLSVNPRRTVNCNIRRRGTLKVILGTRIRASPCREKSQWLSLDGKKYIFPAEHGKLDQTTRARPKAFPGQESLWHCYVSSTFENMMTGIKIMQKSSSIQQLPPQLIHSSQWQSRDRPIIIHSMTDMAIRTSVYEHDCERLMISFFISSTMDKWNSAQNPSNYSKLHNETKPLSLIILNWLVI